MKNRNFKLDTEWNMIHYPEKPKGFGILIIGDERHFVDETSSFWNQYKGKHALINRLNEEGYTVFYSNLYGKNWGSERAVSLAKRLYEHIIRTEIINHKIHIVAEGMGALVAIKLMEKMPENIRSSCLLNPVLSIKYHLEQEKEHKFFYKKLVKELSDAYEVDSIQVIDQIYNGRDFLEDEEVPNIPIRIFQVLSGNRAYKQSKLLNGFSIKWKNKKALITVNYLVPEKRLQLKEYVTKFLKDHEDI